MHFCCRRGEAQGVQNICKRVPSTSQSWDLTVRLHIVCFYLLASRSLDVGDPKPQTLNPKPQTPKPKP